MTEANPFWDEPPWFQQAVCAESEVDPEVFFPHKGQTAAAARAICKHCPVTQACLDYAVTNRIFYGVWGGMTERERYRIRRMTQQ